jgi:SAM-dependent methyltransferase
VSRLPPWLRRLAAAIGLRSLWRQTFGRGYPDDIRRVVQRPLVLRRAGRRLGRTLEVACGEGMYSRALASQASWLVVTDLSPDTVRGVALAADGRGARNGISGRRVCGVAADAQRLPFRARAFQTIVATEVLEHLPDDRGAVGGLRDALALNGSVVVSVPVPPAPIADPFHVREGYTYAQLCALLEAVGLVVSSPDYCLHWLSCWLLPRLQRGGYVPAGLLLLIGTLDRILRIGRPYDMILVARRNR